MGTTYGFLKNVWQQKKLRQQQHDLAPFLITAVLLTIPLPYIVNSIAVILFAAYALFAPKTYRPKLTVTLLLPALLYCLMLISLFWSIDFTESVRALSKELPLLILPLCFWFYKPGAPSKDFVLKNFSYGMAAYAAFYLVRAVVRYFLSGSTDVFFYHDLVTKDVNAIYISAIFSIAFFYFLTKSRKKTSDYAGLALTLTTVILLSSKNIIVIDVLIICIYYLFFASLSKAVRISSAILVVGVVIGVGYFSKIKDRISAEFEGSNKEAHQAAPGVNNLTIHEAYTLPGFTPNDYFNGTAFRVYQIRIFGEMLQEDNILFTGYGLNASLNKIKTKGVEHNVYRGNGDQYGYHMLNFHNQYIEVFADLGVFGFLLLVFIQIFNLKNALKNKDFVHIAFAILMISLFLTESFLWRQRGVVFFTTLYCLFNSAYLKADTKSTI
jgi:O-antigen ligase